MEITLIFLCTSLTAYVLFAGADFGGGILESTLWGHKDLQKRLQATLAPIWEANHVWLIAFIVILFVGFPAAYATLSTMLFVPISMALLGIIFRGSFFTFRKYDPEPKGRLPIYSFLFRTSSIVTPLFFGLMVGSLLQPFPNPQTDGMLGFFELYISPWISPMSILCGLFLLTLFAYLAAVFFYGECETSGDQAIIAKRIYIFFGFCFLTGGSILILGLTSGLVQMEKAWTPFQAVIQILAFLGIPLMGWSLKRHKKWQMRMAAGLQCLCILVGWFSTQFPVFLSFRSGETLTAQNSAAPENTLFWLNIVLSLVLIVVLPPLFYLFKLFDKKSY